MIGKGVLSAGYIPGTAPGHVAAKTSKRQTMLPSLTPPYPQTLFAGREDLGK